MLAYFCLDCRHVFELPIKVRRATVEHWRGLGCADHRRLNLKVLY